jgi:HTH-type transcriptional regulator / antitoxin HigA
MDSIENLLREANSHFDAVDIRQRFEARIQSLGITQHQAQQLLDIENKSLHGILDGTSKRIDYANALKLARFLRLNDNEFASLYARQNTPVKDEVDRVQAAVWLLDTFDLKGLKQGHVLSGKTSPEEVEARLRDFFGVTTNEEFASTAITSMFSQPKRSGSDKMRDFWVRSAHAHLSGLQNPYPYERKQLLELIPKIRPFTQNVTQGLATVVQALYRCGVTVMYQPLLRNVLVHGATLAVQDKPGIVLTDYNKSYPTLWFALMHELHHVLYDWEEIRKNRVHLSGDPDIFLLNEEKSNDFAREYLCARDKSKYVFPFLGNPIVVNQKAREWQIHPSIIYNFAMYDMRQAGDEKAWAKYRSQFPNVELALDGLNVFSWSGTVLENTAALKKQVFTFYQ